jgi:uncharacterized protein (TIGR03437 family)
MKIKFTLLVVLLGVCAWHSSAQTLDSSGDGMLSGTYYMRQVIYFYSISDTELVETLNVQGNIYFNGVGSYTFIGSILNSTNIPLKPETVTTTGSYVISGSGEGYIGSPQYPGDQIVGTVSHGIFIGSTIANDSGYNDLFIAAPVGSTPASNSTLNGSYTVAYLDPTVPGDALFTMTADGQGTIGNVSVTTYSGASATATTESLTGVTYAFNNGGAQINLGGKRSTSTLVAGEELLYISPDGNFIFGGSYNGYDIFAGVRAATSPPTNFSGLYYQAGMDFNESAPINNYSPFDSYYGAFDALAGNMIGHKRFSNVAPLRYLGLNSLLPYGGSSDFSYFDSYTLNSDGSSDDSAFSQHYLTTADGTIRIGYGIGPFLSLNVALQAPAFSPSGVYLDPDGVVNAASSAPFTAQVSPGEFLTLYGSGLAPTTASASLPYPNLFHGVQVMVNGIAAPIYYISPTQISIVVPYLTASHEVAQIFVNNNGSTSNLVSQFTGLTSVGAFTNNPVGGLGYAAALHPDNSVISASSPAQIGETVAVYLAGMGAVSLPVADGTPAPSNPLSVTTSTPLIYLLDPAGHYLQAAVTFSGLAPGYAGLYQINFTVPSGLVAGDAKLEIIGQDSDSFQALFPVSTATSADR